MAVTFFGLTLCVTHLSDVTEKIAAEMLHTFFGFTTNVTWGMFTDKTLNCDTLVRCQSSHYLIGTSLLFFSVSHGVDMHYDWVAEDCTSNLPCQINWYEEGMFSEVFLGTIFFLAVNFWLIEFLYKDEVPYDYEMFMWGDIGFVVDINYAAVAPHWYFRPFMAWLTHCPHHHVGIMGIFAFFLGIYYQPEILEADMHSFSGDLRYFKDPYSCEYPDPALERKKYHVCFIYFFFFQLFFCSVWYTASYLPYGKYYYSISGNYGLSIAYLYIFLYIYFPVFRRGPANPRYRVLAKFLERW